MAEPVLALAEGVVLEGGAEEVLIDKTFLTLEDEGGQGDGPETAWFRIR